MVECIFCSIANGKIPTFGVYEDDKFYATLDINPANKGHVILFPKNHSTSLMELGNSERNHLIQIASQMITQLKRAVGCGGVNTLYSIGEDAGQRTEHMVVHIIPRFKDDKVVIYWEPKKMQEAEFIDVAVKLKEIFGSIKPPAIEVQEKPKRIESEKPPERVDYKIERKKHSYWK